MHSHWDILTDLDWDICLDRAKVTDMDICLDKAKDIEDKDIEKLKGMGIAKLTDMDMDIAKLKDTDTAKLVDYNRGIDWGRIDMMDSKA